MRVTFGDFTLDEDTRQLLRGGDEIHLTRKAFDLLGALLRARPRALSKTELHALLWPDTYVSDANLAMLVAEVRSALEDDARASRFVRTVQRYGYAFHGDAADSDGADTQTPASLAHWLMAEHRQIPLVTGENVVGRDPAVQVWLDSSSVSRRHARIIVQGGDVTLEDLRSKNGTRLQGRRLDAPARLSHGDEIRFGSITLTFHVWMPEQATETETDS
jgi:DNA-binding winged helix-turn-helix (wHTH) protein